MMNLDCANCHHMVGNHEAGKRHVGCAVRGCKCKEYVAPMQYTKDKDYNILYKYGGNLYSEEEVYKKVAEGTWSLTDARHILGLPDIAEETNSTNKRAEILRTAEELINGDRAQTYGPPEISFGRIADIWNAMGYRHHVQVDGAEIGVTKAEKLTAVDAALLLIGMKLSRTVGGPEQMDNWIDMAGYAGLGAELATPVETTENIESEKPLKIIRFNWGKFIPLYWCGADGVAVSPDNIISHMSEYHPHSKCEIIDGPLFDRNRRK